MANGAITERAGVERAARSNAPERTTHSAGRRVMTTIRRLRFQWSLYLLMLPTVLLILVFNYYPSLDAIRYSLYRWDGAFIEEFRGLENFIQAFGHDRLFWQSFGLTLILLVANAFKMWPSIFTAVVIHRLQSERWQYVYRVLFVIPMIIPSLVGLLIWKSFFEPMTGIMNKTLQATHLMDVLQWLDINVLGWQAFTYGSPAWLSNSHLIVPTLIIWGFPWVGVIGVLIYLAGLQNISQDVYDAGKIDGLSWWGKFSKIELPLIMTQVRLMLILMTIGTLQDYGLILILLGPEGGPNNVGMVPGLCMFTEGFLNQRYGYACALGMVLFVIIMSITLVYQKLVRVDK